MAENYKLVYFNKRGGGEIIRLVFEATGVKYEDCRLEMDGWLQIKADTPMRSLPCLQVTREEKTITYCQSGAIAKYLARKFGLYLDSAGDNLLIEEMYDSVGDVRGVFVQIHFCKDEQSKRAMQEKLVTETIPKFAELLKLRQNEFGSNGFIIGPKLTLADLAVFNMVDSCIEMGLESMWKPYNELLQHRLLVMKIPRIEQWLQKRPKTEV